MKKLVLILATVGSSMAASAQAEKAEKFITFGRTASIGGSWISNGERPVMGFNDREGHISYGLGMRMIASVHPNWGMIYDLKFSSEGGRWGSDMSDASLVSRVNYLRHSVQAAYFFGDRGNRIRPKISLGPSIGIVAGGKTRLKDGGTENFPDVKSKNQYKTWDFGLTGAAGANFRIKEGAWLSAEAAYFHGLTNMNDVTSVKMRNRGLALTIGLMMTPDWEKMKNMHKKK